MCGKSKKNPRTSPKCSFLGSIESFGTLVFYFVEFCLWTAMHGESDICHYQDVG